MLNPYCNLFISPSVSIMLHFTSFVYLQLSLLLKMPNTLRTWGEGRQAGRLAGRPAGVASGGCKLSGAQPLSRKGRITQHKGLVLHCSSGSIVTTEYRFVMKCAESLFIFPSWNLMKFFLMDMTDEMFQSRWKYLALQSFLNISYTSLAVKPVPVPIV